MFCCCQTINNFSLSFYNQEEVIENNENKVNCPIVLSTLTFEIFLHYQAKCKESKSNEKTLVKSPMDVFRVHCVIFIK